MKVLDYQIHTPLNDAVISHSQEVLIFSFRETAKGTSHGKYFFYFTSDKEKSDWKCSVCILNIKQYVST